MKKFLLSMFVILGFVTFVYAGVSDVIEMKNSGYKKHKKGIVQFTHKKHTADYNISCGECHHDNNGKPLNLKEGDDVEGCGDCHSNFGKAKKMKKAEKIKKYHKEALHANCIICHKAFNKKKTGKKTKGPAPASCKKCHPKK